MEFKLSKKEMNDLLKQWIIFRDEELSTLTKEDKKHPLRFDEFEERLVKSLIKIENIQELYLQKYMMTL